MNNLDIKYNFKDGAKWDLPVYLNRQNPIPLDGTSVYKTLEEAQTYATSDPKAYPGQIISVVTESEVKVYKINNGKLEELGKGSLVTDQNPKLLATADNIGQIIYLTTQVIDGEDTYSPGPYIVSGDGTVSKIGTTSASGDIAADVAALQGKVGTLENTVDTLENTVGKKGSGDNASTGLVKDVEDLKAKDVELAGQITTLNGKVDKIKVEKLTTAENGFAATYKITDSTGTPVSINIPKDQFLKSVTYVVDKPAEAEGNSADIDFPALKFVWQLPEQAVTYVSVKSLIDNYGIATNENYLKKDKSNNFYIDFGALKTAIIGSETNPDANSVLGKINAAKTAADTATSTAENAASTANTAKTTAEQAKTTAENAASTAGEAKTAADNATSTAGEAKTAAGKATETANTAKTTAEQAKAAADVNTTTLAGHTTSINDLTSKVDKNISDIATNAGNITKNADAIATNTTAINKNTAAIGTQAVVNHANIHIVGTPEQPVAPEGGEAKAEYFLADGAGKELTEADIKEGGIYYIYKRETIKTPDKDRPGEFNTTITTSLVRQATSGAEGDFTYPSITTPSTGLYQYIDNHIKNFDLSWQILD